MVQIKGTPIGSQRKYLCFQRGLGWCALHMEGGRLGFQDEYRGLRSYFRDAYWGLHHICYFRLQRCVLRVTSHMQVDSLRFTDPFDNTLSRCGEIFPPISHVRRKLVKILHWWNLVSLMIRSWGYTRVDTPTQTGDATHVLRLPLGSWSFNYPNLTQERATARKKTYPPNLNTNLNTNLTLT